MDRIGRTGYRYTLRGTSRLRGRQTMRMHRLLPMQRDRQWWNGYDAALRDLPCGQDDYVGDLWWNARQHRAMLIQSRRLAMRRDQLYLRLACAWFALRWRFIFMGSPKDQMHILQIRRAYMAEMAV